MAISTPRMPSVRRCARVRERSCHSISQLANLSDAKCVVLSVDYRLAPENPYPEAIEDAVEALQWVWEQGEGMLGIDTKRIAVGGTSRHVAVTRDFLER